MERTARGRYETHLDDPEFTVMEDGTRFATGLRPSAVMPTTIRIVIRPLRWPPPLRA